MRLFPRGLSNQANEVTGTSQDTIVGPSTLRLKATEGDKDKAARDKQEKTSIGEGIALEGLAHR